MEKVLIKVSGAILHLIDLQYSVELACGDFSIIRLREGENIVAILARIGDEIQWPLVKGEASVKLDESHYFFSLCALLELSDDEDGSGQFSSQSTNDLANLFGWMRDLWAVITVLKNRRMIRRICLVGCVTCWRSSRF